MQKDIFAQQGFHFNWYTQPSFSKEKLQEEQGQLFQLLQIREREFGFNPNIHIHYPSDLPTFLTDPLCYVQQLTQAQPVQAIVILTTYGKELSLPLSSAGYKTETIHLPAGPDHTMTFSYQVPNMTNGATLYIEAVNEQDEKIQPTFVLTLTDTNGVLQGGMSGSIWVSPEGIRYAYIATVVVNQNLPAGSGTQLAQQVLDYLKKENVKEVNLGTQTAEAFYTKMGFKVIHHILPDLRFRTDTNGKQLSQNLVIMSRFL
jgi:N-acetylglutamate synthase-like GNAT family acetyltransferase